MSWIKISDLSVRNGSWVVGKYFVDGIPKYCLTNDYRKDTKIYFESFDEVKEHVRNVENSDRCNSR